MDGFIEKYVNPFTDFGFKKLFGEEPNKELLLDFLNENSLKYYRDLKNSLDTAREEGMLAGKPEVIINGKKEGLSHDLLSLLTGLTLTDIETILARQEHQ